MVYHRSGRDLGLVGLTHGRSNSPRERVRRHGSNQQALRDRAAGRIARGHRFKRDSHRLRAEPIAGQAWQLCDNSFSLDGRFIVAWNGSVDALTLFDSANGQSRSLRHGCSPLCLHRLSRYRRWRTDRSDRFHFRLRVRHVRGRLGHRYKCAHMSIVRSIGRTALLDASQVNATGPGQKVLLPRSARIASGNIGGTVALFDMPQNGAGGGTTVAERFVVGDSPVKSIVATPDEQRLVVTLQNGSVHAVDINIAPPLSIMMRGTSTIELAHRWIADAVARLGRRAMRRTADRTADLGAEPRALSKSVRGVEPGRSHGCHRDAGGIAVGARVSPERGVCSGWSYRSATRGMEHLRRDTRSGPARCGADVGGRRLWTRIQRGWPLPLRQPRRWHAHQDRCIELGTHRGICATERAANGRHRRREILRIASPIARRRPAGSTCRERCAR